MYERPKSFSDQSFFKAPGVISSLPECFQPNNQYNDIFLSQTQSEDYISGEFNPDYRLAQVSCPLKVSPSKVLAHKASRGTEKPLLVNFSQNPQTFLGGFKEQSFTKSRSQNKLEDRSLQESDFQMLVYPSHVGNYPPFMSFENIEANPVFENILKEYDFNQTFPISNNKSIGQLVEEELLSAPSSRGSSCNPSSSSNSSTSSSPSLSQPPQGLKFEPLSIEGFFRPSSFNLTPQAPPVESTITKKFFCNKCGKGHSRQSNLLAHLRDTHSNTKKVFCDVEGCKKAYKRVSECRRHKKDMHGIPLPSELLGKTRKLRRFAGSPF
ncbi:expressed protein [Phakopsora pachyrhizi]|uniref:Expressed protein n=1 Tax=Phakopsora pachyrhizi TaxID=170000 RepID=A0AAV0B6N5_PHAPC|nr:expressed protein [Phakopsora pachyrhizi]